MIIGRCIEEVQVLTMLKLHLVDWHVTVQSTYSTSHERVFLCKIVKIVERSPGVNPAMKPCGLSGNLSQDFWPSSKGYFGSHNCVS